MAPVPEEAHVRDPGVVLVANSVHAYQVGQVRDGERGQVGVSGGSHPTASQHHYGQHVADDSYQHDRGGQHALHPVPTLIAEQYGCTLTLARVRGDVGVDHGAIHDRPPLMPSAHWVSERRGEAISWSIVDALALSHSHTCRSVIRYWRHHCMYEKS